jgi:hypothetical protein
MTESHASLGRYLPDERRFGRDRRAQERRRRLTDEGVVQVEIQMGLRRDQRRVQRRRLQRRRRGTLLPVRYQERRPSAMTPLDFVSHSIECLSIEEDDEEEESAGLESLRWRAAALAAVISAMVIGASVLLL